MENLKKVIISKRAELAAKGGHPWIYGTEIEHADEGIEAVLQAVGRPFHRRAVEVFYGMGLARLEDGNV